jgi:hypothetical protein
MISMHADALRIQSSSCCMVRQQHCSNMLLVQCMQALENKENGTG